MADLPIEQSVPLAVLKSGIAGGLDTAIARQDPYKQLKEMYAALDESRRERLAALERNGRVPTAAVAMLYKEQMAQPARKPPHAMGVRGSIDDTTESTLT